MSSRRSTPDIMGDLMGGIAVKEENLKNIKPYDTKTIRQENNKTIKPSSNAISPSLLTQKQQAETAEPIKEADEMKEKITMMLPSTLLVTLEDKWIELRKLFGSKQVSKSLIIQKALELALSEFEQTKEHSALFSLLANTPSLKQ